jgi:hypothetical protein
MDLANQNEAHPTAVGLTDLNGDGSRDIVASDYGNSVLAVFLNDGAGAFGPQASYPTGTDPKSLALGDFNDDGHPDVLTPNEASSNVSMLPGDGSGGLGIRINSSAGTTPHVAAVADFNGDDDRDVAIVNDSLSGAVTVLLGTGTGKFGSPTSYPTSSNPRSIAVGDFNEDGKADLAIAFEQEQRVGVMFGDGTGGFTGPTYFTAGIEPKSVAVGDLDHDGHQDLVVADEGDDVSPSTVSTLLGDGSGGFAAAVAYDVGIAPKFVALGDLNGDGDLDAVVADYGHPDTYDTTDNVAVLLGKGDGTFAAATFWRAGNGPKWVAIGDVNRDRLPDLVVADNDSGKVSVLLQDNTPPATSDDADAAWHNRSVTVSLTAVDSDSGTATITYRVDRAATWKTVALPSAVVAIPAPADHSGDGTHTIDYFATDNAGNVAATRSCTVRIDTTKPHTSVTGNDDLWHPQDVTVTFSATDGLSGVSTTGYRIDDADWTTGGSATVLASAGDGRHTVSYRSTDKAGNIEDTGSVSVLIDTASPVTHASGHDAAWHRTPVTVTLTATDSQSGVAETQYQMDGEQQWTTGAALTVSANGSHTVRYRSVDAAGNVEMAKACTVKIDTIKPVPAALRAASMIRGRSGYIRYRIADVRPGSPSATVIIRIRTLRGKLVKTLTLTVRPVNTMLSTTFVCRLARGSYRFFVSATDAAGNSQAKVARNRLTVS